MGRPTDAGKPLPATEPGQRQRSRLPDRTAPALLPRRRPTHLPRDHTGLPASAADPRRARQALGQAVGTLLRPRRRAGLCLASGAACRLLAERPDRTLSGTNWPHPQTDPVPDQGALVGRIAAAPANPATLRRILAENPARLCGFGRD